MGNLNFDSTGVEPAVPLDTLPPGDYTMHIVNSGFEPTKDGQGSFLKLEMQVLTGPHEGRKVFDRLNLNNKSAEAVNIARRTLAAICHAIGKPMLENHEDLRNIPLTVKLKTVPRKDNGVLVPNEWSNEVKGYLPLNGGAGKPAGASSGAASGSTAGSGEGALPWQR